MRKTIANLCFCLLLLTAPSVVWAACSKPLTVGWESWKPFMYVGENGQLTGLDIELIQAVAKRMDCTLRFVEMPFKRHMLELENGRIDLATSVQFTAERERYALYSKPYRESQMRLAMLSGEVANYPLTQLEQLRDRSLRLGITRGYFYGPGVEALIADPGQLTIEDAISDKVNLAKLEAGRIDGFFVDPIVLASLAPAAGRIELHPLAVHSSSFHFIASSESVSVQLMQAFDEALAQLQASGELQAIVGRYQLH